MTTGNQFLEKNLFKLFKNINFGYTNKVIVIHSMSLA